jgi:sRNA-binding carbon storage regulator CsrA
LLAVKGRKAIGVALLGLSGLTGGLSACGDDGVSKADYLTKAKTVCQQGKETLTKASNEVLAKIPPGQKMTQPEIEDFVRKTVVPTIREQVRQLRALEAPKDEKAHIEEIYSALDKGIDELEQTPSKLTDGSNVFATADTLAEKYGISVCATTTG